jgi:hypothetical protein
MAPVGDVIWLGPPIRLAHPLPMGREATIFLERLLSYKIIGGNHRLYDK